MARKPKPYTPPVYDIQVNSLIPIKEEINTIFNTILLDYCRRFKVKVKKDRENADIMLSLIQGGSAPTDMDGLCAFEEENKLNRIAIQIRCVVLEGMVPYEFVMQHWAEILTHEMVHVCQTLTGRKMEIPEYVSQEVYGEDYYFDPDEVEARMLQAFYTARINTTAFNSISDKFSDAFSTESTE